MLNWVIVLILIALVFAFLRFRHLNHKIFAVIIIILLLFFYTTATKLASDNNVNLKTFDGIVSATKLYLSWLGDVFFNLKDLTGQAVDMEWGIDINNSTNK